MNTIRNISLLVAKTSALPTSHVAMLSRPKEVAAVILAAAEGTK